MRIVSWNCCGKFREKFTKLTELDADIYVIQECENPETATHQEYKKFAENALWQGYTPSRGLGVFPRSSLSVKQLGWENCLLRHFMPVAINGLTLLAVWACRPYIEEYAIYQAIHYDKFNSEMVVIGDLNSNKIWDKKSARIPSGRSHSDVVSRLAQKGLRSAYHYINGENTFALSGRTVSFKDFVNREWNADDLSNAIELVLGVQAQKVIPQEPMSNNGNWRVVIFILAGFVLIVIVSFIILKRRNNVN